MSSRSRHLAYLILAIYFVIGTITVRATFHTDNPQNTYNVSDSIAGQTFIAEPDSPAMTTNIPETMSDTAISLKNSEIHCPTIYSLPYSDNIYVPDKKRMLINASVLTGAFISTLFVLECLPEDATNWNKAEIRRTPIFKRWYNNVVKDGPMWDNDKFVMNYILHPYAGAAYFMAARSCGYNFWRSMLFSTAISTIGWEFGVEAFMERPSYQDIVLTPVVGSIIGESFYKIKRHIVSNGYRLAGSKILGNIVAFIVDPVNEFIGFFAGNPARHYANTLEDTSARHLPVVESSFTPMVTKGGGGFRLVCNF